MGRKHDKKEEASIILEILNRIPLSKRFVSVDDILNSLASADIDVSRRSLQRYLKQMYDCGKYGLVRDDRGNAYGYRRERTDSITDNIHLKPNECLLLRIAQEHMKYQIPGTVLKSLGFLFDAASEMLKEKGSNAKENQWLNKVCVISSSIPQMPSKVLPRIFDVVSEALYSEKKLRIEDALAATKAAVEEGIVAGGGIACMNAIPAVSAFVDTLEGDAKTGAKIVLKALEEPLRQIAANAGLEGSVICENIKKANKVGYGFNALTEEYTDMIEAGIVDPTKVTRSALQNASSVAAMVLTTESLVADIKEPAASAAPAAPDMGGMY